MKKIALVCAILLMCLSMVAAQDERALVTAATPDSILDWSLPMPTEEQLEAARTCSLDEESLPEATDSFEAETACDWARLAIAYASSVGEDEPLPEEALAAYAETASMNPALLLANDMLFHFWNRLDNMIAIPDIARQPIVEVTVDYRFNSGMVRYRLHLVALENGTFSVSGTVHDNDPYAGEDGAGVTHDYEVSDVILEAEQIEALRLGLRNLVPIGNAYTDQPCWHIFPDWDVTLIFEDGSEILLETHESNLLSSGGPWMTTIDGQTYMQVDASFLIALGDIVYETLDLPWGHFMSYGCSGARDVLTAGFTESSE